MDRRDFLRTAGAGLTAAGVAMTPREQALAQSLEEKARFERIAGCSWPMRSLFKTRPAAGRGVGGRGGAAGGDAGGRGTAPAGRGQAAPTQDLANVPAIPANRDRTPAAEMKQRYGEITMLDFPQFVKDTFPGVRRLDIFSGLFGDVTDDSMFITAAEGGGGGAGFDPMSPSGRKWLDRLANVLVKTGTKVQHISNNAPFALADHGSLEADTRRKAGVAMAKRWMEGCAVLGITSMRMNSPQALGPSIRPNAIPRSADGYPRNLDLVPLLDAAIESYKEMADFGGDRGIIVSFENHWGLAADPINLRIMVDAVNHPFCALTPDFCNWEHEYMLVSGLKAVAPYSVSNVHAKYWDRWGDSNDVRRGVRIMLAAGFNGTFALEYEAGPLNGVEGAKYLYQEVLAALKEPATAS
ncbi:MAG TPA: TIM barrel protein [Vicinamibacterales bacterium]|nr:TIM barrel protein [Vicinamibacterales bacterium]